MIKTAMLLAALAFSVTPVCAGQAPALPPFGATPELLVCAMVTLAAIGMAWIGLRRSATVDERARALLQQLRFEREARNQADEALAANHDVMCRLVREQEGVREGERSRIARDLQSELGRRLLTLRSELSRLQVGDAPQPALAGALANIDGAIDAVRTVAGGLRGFGPGDGLRHALERCLAEHAHLNGLRYRFEAGIDPAARASQDRAARLAVFRVLQEVLASGVRGSADGEVSVRLSEGAGVLGLEIGGCTGVAALPDEVHQQVRALGGVLRIADSGPDGRAGGRRSRLSLSVPVRELAEHA